jgi:hypothetical protein
MIEAGGGASAAREVPQHPPTVMAAAPAAALVERNRLREMRSRTARESCLINCLREENFILPKRFRLTDRQIYSNL